MKKLISILLVCALMPILPITAHANASEGIYEGEYDANGKRSGYGTWTYDNYLFVGNWENDLPNGEGTLYSHERYESDGRELIEKCIVQGNWVDGLAQGAIEESYVKRSGSVTTYRLDVKDGCTTSDERVSSIDERFSIQRGVGWPVGIVPPWADARMDSSIPAPSPTFEYDADMLPAVAEVVYDVDKSAEDASLEGFEDGIYDGEHDADGKRNGFGTWAYHNFLYAGNWANGLPNGEGTLYYWEQILLDDGSTLSIADMTHGNRVNGWLDGTIEYTTIDINSGEDGSHTFRINDVEKGKVAKDQLVPARNDRSFRPFYEGTFFGGVEPWTRGCIPVDNEVDTPWVLYEMYPTGRIENTFPKIEHTGMGFPPGNLANAWQERSGFGIAMAALGDWIFFCAPTGKGDYAAYKMRPDGSQMVKLYESKHFMPNFQVIDDWLYINVPFSEGLPPSKMRADDFEFTTESQWNCFRGVVVDDWEYKYGNTLTNELSLVRHDLASTKLEYIAARDDEYDYHPVVFADEDWVYVCEFNGAGPQWLAKIKLNGSSETERHQIGNTSLDSPYCGGQVVGGRIYYSEGNIDISNYNAGSQRRLLSVDLDFSSAPMTVVNPEKDHSCGAFNVTDDYIYYADMYDILEPKVKTAIIRVDHDGSNPVVLADGLKGYLTNMFVAGDWMAFALDGVGYMMRLDGGGLHKVGEAYVPEDAPGVVDSSGKWRYEVLEDGSAKILGAGGKLKQSGKLSIPATVDKIPVVEIGENAFYGCDGFTGLTIPKGVTTIGDFSFFWCNGLTSVTIPEGVVHIGSGAFQYCSKIKKISLPASLTSIGGGAFAHCPTVKLSVAKKNETFEIVDGALFDRLQNRVVD